MAPAAMLAIKKRAMTLPGPVLESAWLDVELELALELTVEDA